MLSVVVRHVYLSFVQCIVTGTYCLYGVVCCYGMRTYGSYDGLCVVLPILLTLVSLKRELSQKSSHVLFSPYFLTLVSLKRELSHGAL